jgi:1A family penicillin-binding protein
MTMRRVVAAVGAALALAVATACSLEPIDLAAERPLALRSEIRASNGRLLAQLFRQNRVHTSLDAMPQHLQDAVLAAEDSRFFEHPGYDVKAIARAALINARENRIVQGGSTITQQYVKNSYFRDPPRTVERKARELRIAIELERRYSKREILERYLNTIYLGAGAYGVGAASEVFFNKPVEKMRLHEAAMIAAMIKAPSNYDPRQHPKDIKVRRDYVLRRMANLGMITDEEATAAQSQPLGVVKRPPRIGLREPYFVEAVKREIMHDRRLGLTADERARLLWEGGIEVETTLDERLQAAAEAAVNRVLWAKGDPAAALVAIRPSTGRIVAMVAGRDWKASQVNLALGREGGGSGRQTGSSFKPIVAAAALEAGRHLDDMYESSGAVFTFDEHSDPWSVNNYEGSGSGLLRLDEAMVRSVNGVYARLALDIGASAVVNQAKVMGVQAPLRVYPSIALGSQEVSVLDMATAYATLANYGVAVTPTTIEKIKLPGGEVIQPEQGVTPGAIAPGNAYLLTKVLEQVILRGTGRAAQIDRPAAGKTGTTNNYSDAWFVGYTPDLVAAVWVGYPEGLVPMTNVHGIRVAGGTFPAIIWREFMLDALRGSPAKQFRLPQVDMVTVLIDPASGLLAAPWCPGEPKKMLKQLAPTRTCPVPPPPEPSPSPSPTGDKDDGKKGDDEATPSPSPTGKATPLPKPSAKG